MLSADSFKKNKGMYTRNVNLIQERYVSIRWSTVTTLFINVSCA